MHYKFRYEERYLRFVDVEADTPEQAEDLLREALCADRIAIDKNGDFADSRAELEADGAARFGGCDDYISKEEP